MGYLPTAPDSTMPLRRSYHASDSAPFLILKRFRKLTQKKMIANTAHPAPCDGFCWRSAGRFSISAVQSMQADAQAANAGSRRVIHPPRRFDTAPILFLPPARGQLVSPIGRRRNTPNQAHDNLRWRSCLISILVAALGCPFATGALLRKETADKMA